jgi:hypothetical protein
MIRNLPTAQTLCESSITIYFNAWDALQELIQKFEENYQVELYVKKTDEYDEEREDYIERIQPDLKVIANLVQQSNELALKAKIAKVSPYLLLTNIEKKIGAAKDYDFHEFITLEAMSLIRVSNGVTSCQLSESFTQLYEKYRTLRNQITHLGYSEILSAQLILADLIEFYISLWPDRHWLKDRLAFNSVQAIWHFSHHTCPEAEVLYGWDNDLKSIQAQKFIRLFSVKKKDLSFLCPHCYKAAKHTDYDPPPPKTAKTAYLFKGSKINCLMCQSNSVMAG